MLIQELFNKLSFMRVIETNSQACTVSEKSRETVSEFYKETTKVF